MRNSSCNNCTNYSWAKLIIRSVLKIGMSFTGMKNWDNSVLLGKTHAIITQCSKPVKNTKKPVFWNLFVQISGLIWMVVSKGCFSHQHTKRKWSLCWQPFNSDFLCYPCYPLLPHVTPCYPCYPLLPLVTPCYPCYPLLPLLPLVTPCYPCYPLLPHVTPCYPSYPMLPLVTLSYPLLPLVTLVTPC